MKPIQCVTSDPVIIARVKRVAEGRRHKKLTRTFRELALERLAQIEAEGDPHALKQSSTAAPDVLGKRGVRPAPARGDNSGRGPKS